MRSVELLPRGPTLRWSGSRRTACCLTPPVPWCAAAQLARYSITSRMLKNSSTGAHHVQVWAGDLSQAGRFRKAA
jgi:hypothetical protein